jgi:hypothetical protein
VPTVRPPSRSWLDEGEVSAAWGPPAGTPDHGRTLSPATVPLAVLVALALVLAVVGGLGGFERRTNLLHDTPTGMLVATGPYELRFTSATAQQRTRYDGVVTWRVTMTGEGRTTGKVTIAPEYSGDYGMFVAKDDASGEIQVPQGQTFGPRQRIGGAFTPGLPLQPFTVQFDFSSAYRPQRDVTFVVYRLELRDASLLGNQDEEWRNATWAYRFHLPLEVLPTAQS